MPVFTVEPGHCMLMFVDLLFSFELCSLRETFQCSARLYTCYFLLNYALPMRPLLVAKKGCRIRQNLLFSFELCGVGNALLIATKDATCYFLLNYAFYRWANLSSLVWRDWLAIFFWIMPWRDAITACHQRAVAGLAIFFWIMPPNIKYTQYPW